ncbi:MAG: bifunctional adenosylcobinamide kinase/adenosylcobinamide-phosphate guanylyltransferase [Ignavibacteriales bacterium]
MTGRALSGPAGRIVLITGGARSGKSRLAEQMASARGPDVLYVATAAARDPEMARRIACHRERRPPSWRVAESPSNPAEALRAARTAPAPPSAVIVDCLTVLVSNLLLRDLWLTEDDREMDDSLATLLENRGEECLAAVREMLEEARLGDLYTLMVTNELGLGLVPEYPAARVYRDVVGRVNQAVANEADEVWLVCSGIPVRLKPGPVVSGWPARGSDS